MVHHEVMPVSLPVLVSVPVSGVVFAESVHSLDFRMKQRSDPFHKILHVQRGRVELHLTGEAKPLSGATGAVFMVSAGCAHRIVDIAPSVILLLCLGTGWLKRTEGLPELWKNLEFARVRELSGAAMAGWQRLWRHALLEQGRERTGSDVLRDALAMQLLVTLARQPQRRQEDSTEERVRRVTGEISETFFDPWTIDVAARRAGLSRRHFTQCFRDLNRQTLVNFLNDHRLDHAERLLLSGRHTVTGAVFSSGFDDLAHFYRLFKRRHGLAPGAWLQGDRS